MYLSFARAKPGVSECAFLYIQQRLNVMWWWWNYHHYFYLTFACDILEKEYKILCVHSRAMFVYKNKRQVHSGRLLREGVNLKAISLFLIMKGNRKWMIIKLEYCWWFFFSTVCVQLICRKLLYAAGFLQKKFIPFTRNVRMLRSYIFKCNGAVFYFFFFAVPKNN